MANNVSVQISANVQGFEQGMNKATESARQYETETRKISESTVNFNKQLREAKKTVKDLAGSYAQLDAETKKSQFGKEMAKQLEEAKLRAAELIDMNGDLTAELKNLASDTRLLDTLSEGFGVIADTAASAMGIIAQFTGNEEDAQRAVVAFTTAQSALGAVTKLQNALQMQSNTMLAVTKVQTLAAAAAENIKTAAQGKGVIATKAATAAQAAFNAVAYANPYVLLAAAVLGVVTALGVYIASTNNSESATEKQNREIAEANKQWDGYKAKVADSVASQVADFIALQKEWENLKTTEEKNEFLDTNKNKLHNMGLEIDDINELENLFVKNSAAVVKALKARAEAEAWGEIYKERLKKKLENDLNGSVANGRYYKTAKAGDVITDEESKALGIANKQYILMQSSAGAYYQVVENGITKQQAATVNAYRNAQALKIQKKEAEGVNEVYDKYTESLERSREATAALDTTLTHRNKKTGGSNTNNNDKNTPPKELTELEKLEQKVKDIENERAKINIEAPNAQELIAAVNKRLADAKAELTKYKIAVGIEVEPSELDKMEAELKTKELMLRADLPQSEKDKVYNEILELKDKIQKAQIAAHIIIDPEIEIKEKQQKEINDIVNGALNPKEEKSFNFSFLPENVAPEAEKLLEEYNRLAEAREKLNEIMNNPESTDTQISAAQAGLDQLSATFDQITEKVDFFQEWSDAIEDAQKKTEKLSQTVKGVGDAVSAAGDLFSALGEAADNEGMQALGIVAKAVATVALSFAQALTTCKTWYEWLAFGISGAATMVSMISQIKSLTSGYAQGGPVGMVGGSSYNGDNMLIRVNSGEAIINQRQQKRLFDILDGKALPNNGGSGRVEVTGIIRGTDLLLVQKNANKKLSKAGNSISIG